MSDISQLLKEAKPLYFKRKKRRKQIKIGVSVMGCLMMAVLISSMPYRYYGSAELENFYAYLYDDSSYDAAIGSVDTSVANWFELDEIG